MRIPISPAVSDVMKRELANIVGEEFVLTSAPDRLAYNNDCWPRGIILTRGRQLRAHQPAAIVQPENEQEILALVQWARATSTPIVPYGAGSGVCGGAVANGDGIIIDMKRLRAISNGNHDDLTVHAQSGVIGMNLERELNRQGFTLGHFPSSLYCSSLGGYLAARSAGQTSSRWGKIEDMVVSMRVVTGAAEIIDTAPNPRVQRPIHHVLDCGFDPTQLFVGSEGTLGILTDATLRIDVKPSRQIYRGFQFESVERAFEAIREMMQMGLRPAVVRLYDAFDSLIARRKAGRNSKESVGTRALMSRLSERALDTLPLEAGAELKGRLNQVTHGLLGRVLGQPIVINTLINVLPQDCLLVIGFEGQSDIADAEAHAAFSLLSKYGTDLGEGPGKHWLKHRMDVSYKQSAMFDAGAFVDTMEVSTTWSNLDNLYQSVRQALAPHVLVMAHFSHVYPEGSSIYFTFAGFGADLDDTLLRYETTWRVAMETVMKAGASVAHHHGVGQSKAAYTNHDHPGGHALFEALKTTFDPDGIMNPGKVYLKNAISH